MKFKKLFIISMAILNCTCFTVFAQDVNLGIKKLLPEIHKAVDKDAKRVHEIFKDIHQHPELGFMEFRTAGIVAKELRELGFEVKTEIGITGVVGILKNGDGPTFMFRGDMDALPIKEETGLSYASQEKVYNLDGVEVPVSHMCGHDAHTAWTIALAKSMVRLKDKWSGTLVIVAQPAEEPIEGAIAMINDGMYTRHSVPKPDYYLTFHSGPFSVGTVVLTGGRLNTGSQHIDVKFHGSGGHGSSPHHATDPIIMAGMAIVQYQTIVSRMADPTETSVLTVGMVQAGATYNVIPTEANLKLKLHYPTIEAGEKMINGIKRISDNTAKTYGITSKEMMPEISIKGYAPPVVNSEEWIKQIRTVLSESEAADKIINDERVTEGVAVHDLEIPGSDDAFVLIEGMEAVKGAYIGIGTANADLVAAARSEGKEFPFYAHEPNYIVDLEGITYGTKVATIIALDALGK
ncbi:amidohydrolase [Algoriphagus sediminis]|uniref:Amidohydrolase n=1 Tax=Algoriphagus sediminis TaxID=3057113 RepID=A0ABT7Y9M8_9BACT|nr:amidohydrolase [Algoriphagus sediminis]MDN3203221.1 amidohydrolase [Algoriphagus sediminis]